MPERRRGVTRRQIIAGFFLAVGLLLLLTNIGGIGAEEPLTTKLGFGSLPPPPGSDERPRQLVWEVPTALSLSLIGAFYLAACRAAGRSSASPRRCSGPAACCSSRRC
jgi:general nucleoside transport system permease protein